MSKKISATSPWVHLLYVGRNNRASQSLYLNLPWWRKVNSKESLNYFFSAPADPDWPIIVFVCIYPWPKNRTRALDPYAGGGRRYPYHSLLTSMIYNQFFHLICWGLEAMDNLDMQTTSTKLGNYLCTRSESSLLHTSIWYVANRLRDWVSKYNVCEFLKCKSMNYYKYMAEKIIKKVLQFIITQPISISNRHLFRM